MHYVLCNSFVSTFYFVIKSQQGFIIVSQSISLKKPNRKVLASLIDTITLDENLNIEIFYKIKTPI